jgi:DNA-binding response OmpR family regulator
MVASAHRATVLEPDASSVSADVSPRRRAHRFCPRVVLIEPDQEGRSELAQGLVGAGFEVLAAAAIEDVLVELEEPHKPPHLIIADVGAAGGEGGLDGFAWCERLRAEPRTEHIPIFLLAPAEAERARERAEEVRADDCLVKPVAVQCVVSLARLVAGRRACAPAYEAHSSRLPLCQVVGALLAGGRAGRVELRDNEGWLSFRQGHVVDASFGEDKGHTAIRRLLLFGSGAYAVSFGEQLARGELLLDQRSYFSQLSPAAERFASLCALGIPLSARLTVDFKRLADVLSGLPDDVGRVIRLFDGQRTVLTTIHESHLSEVVTLEAVTCLYALGVLVPAVIVAEREPVPRYIPPFFEPMLPGDEEPFSTAFAAEATP